MVNYDLPWNPNRLEQRFGRIHRIGQTEVCHLWNLCATNTREGEVYQRLLEKLEQARAALGGKVYDVLGELFEGQALRDLLVDAIRYGDAPETKARLFQKVDDAVDVESIERLVAERKLTSEGMDPNAVAAIREEMERAQARRLQPHFIGAFFREAFQLLGGRIAEREKGRFEIATEPAPPCRQGQPNGGRKQRQRRQARQYNGALSWQPSIEEQSNIGVVHRRMADVVQRISHLAKVALVELKLRLKTWLQTATCLHSGGVGQMLPFIMRARYGLQQRSRQSQTEEQQ
jgi:hypothetical protein